MILPFGAVIFKPNVPVIVLANSRFVDSVDVKIVEVVRVRAVIVEAFVFRVDSVPSILTVELILFPN